jgi:hypothetical protein
MCLNRDEILQGGRMSVALAAAWNINERDLERFRRRYPLLMTIYSGISIAAAAGAEAAWLAELAALPGIKLRAGQAKFENRRYYALEQALEFSDAEYIHYSDADHALVRLERFPDDYRVMLEAIQQVDCLIVGRSPAVFESYPPALRETERIINQVGSFLLGQPVDLGSGSRGFSRRAVEYLMQHASPETHGVATDAEYPVRLHGAGFSIGTYESDGAIYEIHDEQHDARLHSAEQWAKRVDVARLIIEAGIAAAR